MKIGDKVEIDGRPGTIATAPYDRSGMLLVIFDDVSSFFGGWVIIDRSLLTSGINSDRESRCECAPDQGGPCSFCMEEKYNL